MNPTTRVDPFTKFANELATNLDLITRLLTTHPAVGPCHGCRLPGPTPPPQSPCGVRNVAVLALEIRLRQENGTA